MTKDRAKQLRDREQFDAEVRTFALKIGKQRGPRRYGVGEEDKLRKMIYAERKEFQQERKNFRADIIRLQRAYSAGCARTTYSACRCSRKTSSTASHSRCATSWRRSDARMYSKCMS